MFAAVVPVSQCLKFGVHTQAVPQIPRKYLTVTRFDPDGGNPCFQDGDSMLSPFPPSPFPQSPHGGRTRYTVSLNVLGAIDLASSEEGYSVND
jgi:hypothetical protein